MSKQKGNVLTVIVYILIIILTILAIIFLPKEKEKKKTESEVVSSEVSSSVNVEDIETEEKKDESEQTESKVESNFITPDETEADKILEENKNKNNVSSSSVSNPVTSDASKKDEETNYPKTFEDGKKQLEDIARDYLEKNNIDPKTAGETGEICPNCGKKIWNPDKYGNFIPGMPEDYENSGYCLGTCALFLE